MRIGETIPKKLNIFNFFNWLRKYLVLTSEKKLIFLEKGYNPLLPLKIQNIRNLKINKS